MTVIYDLKPQDLLWLPMRHQEPSEIERFVFNCLECGEPVTFRFDDEAVCVCGAVHWIEYRGPALCSGDK